MMLRKRKLIDNGDGTFTVPLTRDYVATIDAEDASAVGGLNWNAHSAGNTFYAKSWPKNKSIALHRFILKPPSGVEVDHINHNGLDCRRSNMRLATKSQQQWNTRPRKGTTSRFKGVSKSRDKWHAEIQCNKRRLRLGAYDTEEEAAAAYNEAAKRLFGEFACV